ncbi:hypothetical protein [Nocardioides marmoraquaticus]
MSVTPVDPAAPPRGPGPEAATGTSRRQPPRLVTVLAGVGVLVALTGLLAVVSPAVREQLALSVGRQDAPYVETWFADTVAARSCSPDRPRYGAEVAVRSHLTAAEDVAWELRLRPVRGGRPVVERGSVTVLPDRVAVVAVSARKPRGGFVAEVRFPGRDQRLLVRCTGERR